MSETSSITLREAARRTRMRAMRVTLTTTMALALAAYFAVDATAAEGVLLGGIAGALGFWTMSLRLERIVLVRPDKLQVALTVWTFYRLIIYGVFLFIAYGLDRSDLHGVFGAMAGLFSTRFAVTFLGIAEARSKQRERERAGG